MKKYEERLDDEFIWEPISELEMAPIDTEGEIFDVEARYKQEYYCYVIGHCLHDSEACLSLIEIKTDQDMNSDKTLAKLILDALKFKDEADRAKKNQLSIF